MAIKIGTVDVAKAALIDECGQCATHECVVWALGRLRDRLATRGITLGAGSADGRDGIEIRLELRQNAAAKPGAVLPPDTSEAFAIVPLAAGPAGSVVLVGADRRGLVHAVLELADMVHYAPDGTGLPVLAAPVIEAPSIPVRSISRCFSSEIEDKSWLHDTDGWREYFDMLAEARINRFALTLGMHYNYPYGQEFLNDVYLIFAYPFLVDVPGFKVRAEGLPDAERDLNLQMLRFISRECARRGIDFQLALWFQRYDFDDTPAATYQIRGIDESRHAEYCRDALRIILRECPDISGITLRVHVECGIPEASYDFWRTYLSALDGLGRTIRIDMHAKGIDHELIEIALATGNPVSVSPKYTLEQQGLPYHQASIRTYENPPKQAVDPKWRFSEGTRKFLRYSYGDLMKTDRRYDILFRIWPGTQRVLLWADHEIAAGYGREAGMCGALGVELCEPLSFKGRMGAAHENGRQLYTIPALQTRYDWDKFRYQYRVWGRRLFSDDTAPESWQRPLLRRYGASGAALDEAIAAASRFALLLTTAHAPSASNNSWWPEMYENMSIVTEAPKLPYGYDMLAPARYGTVSGGDPQFFGSIEGFVKDLLTNTCHSAYTPLTVANWFETIATTARQKLGEARLEVAKPDAEFLRIETDIVIQAAMSLFFARKHRAGFAWEIWLATGYTQAAQAALTHYEHAIAAWGEAAEAGRAVYAPDLAFGHFTWLRGRWDDRVDLMRGDVAAMRARFMNAPVAPVAELCGRAEAALALVGEWHDAQHFFVEHQTPSVFEPGTDLALTLTTNDAAAEVWLHYRPVDQSAAWRSLPMSPMACSDGRTRYVATIPGRDLDGIYPLQYYAERRAAHASGFFPGLCQTLSNRPYLVVPARRAGT